MSKICPVAAEKMPQTCQKSGKRVLHRGHLELVQNDFFCALAWPCRDVEDSKSLPCAVVWKVVEAVWVVCVV